MFLKLAVNITQKIDSAILVAKLQTSLSCFSKPQLRLYEFSRLTFFPLLFDFIGDNELRADALTFLRSGSSGT